MVAMATNAVRYINILSYSTIPLDESTLEMSRILRSEVQSILKLPKDDNIVEILGWCKTGLYDFRNYSGFHADHILPYRLV